MDGSSENVLAVILAQIYSKEGAATVTGFGIAGVSFASMMGWIIRRQMQRMISHVDDTRIHIDVYDPPMKQSVCRANHDALLREMQQMNDSLATITKHIMSEKKS